VPRLGSGKTALVLSLCRHLRDNVNMGAPAAPSSPALRCAYRCAVRLRACAPRMRHVMVHWQWRGGCHRCSGGAPPA